MAFAIGNYDHGLPLVIDPVLGYSTYFGGNFGETPWAVALDGNNNIYIAGQTFSTRFTNNGVPFSFSTTNAYQTNYHGGSVLGDAFVAKLDNAGTNLIYLTYLGGSADDMAYGLAVDAAGNAYVAGYTDSTNFPTTNALFPKISGQLNSGVGYYPVDAFVTELNASGSGLVYSTYLGGNAADVANGIAVDAAGDAYVTGFTASTNFPTSANALQKKMACLNSVYYNFNGFVTELGPNGTNLLYSSFLGGTNKDVGESIAVDNSNFVYVTGYTESTNFPTTNGVARLHLPERYRPTVTLSDDAFVTKLVSGCTGVVYSTFLGRTNSDMATGIACDGSGNAFVVGQPASPLFPQLQSRFDSKRAGQQFQPALPDRQQCFSDKNRMERHQCGHPRLGPFRWHQRGCGLEGGGGSGRQRLCGGFRDFHQFPDDKYLRVVSRHQLRRQRRVCHRLQSTVARRCSIRACSAARTMITATASPWTGRAPPMSSARRLRRIFRCSTRARPFCNGTNDAFLAKIYSTLPSPTLAARLSGTNLLVSWPPIGQETPDLFKLESTTNLRFASWQTVTQQVPVFTNGVYRYTFNPTNFDQFFRLHKN